MLDCLDVDTPRVEYAMGLDGTLIFIRVCPICHKFVQADNTIRANEYGPKKEPNATCSEHGRVMMPYDGWGA